MADIILYIVIALIIIFALSMFSAIITHSGEFFKGGKRKYKKNKKHR